MSDKRKRDSADTAARPDSHKKAKKGFTVGPANLPDGTYKRKNQKIKNALIERAQIKKQYAKLKRQANVADKPSSIPTSHPTNGQDESAETGEVDEPPDQLAEPSTEPHPDRANLMSRPSEPTVDDAKPERTTSGNMNRQRQRRPRQDAFARESKEAQWRREEAEARRKAREEAESQRQARLAERETFRKAMAKARNGNGQRKLGRESKVLLAKAQRLMAENGG